jgi:hypothetical protein
MGCCSIRCFVTSIILLLKLTRYKRIGTKQQEQEMTNIPENIKTSYNIPVVRYSSRARWFHEIFKHPEVLPMNEFCKYISDLFIHYVGADCWAVTHNGADFYNNYLIHNNVRAKMDNDRYRRQLLNESDATDFFKRYCHNGDKVHVYMFHSDGFFVEYECIEGVPATEYGDNRYIQVRVFSSETYSSRDYQEVMQKIHERRNRN